MRVTSATPPAAGRFAYVSNLPSLRPDPVLQPRGDDGFGAGAPGAFDLPCLVVDDGSDETTRRTLEALAADRPQVTLLRLAENSGKGAAVMQGLKACADRGFTHAVQVDADGQHAIEDIPKLLALAERHPDALISGQPVYDDSIPVRACTGAG